MPTENDPSTTPEQQDPSDEGKVEQQPEQQKPESDKDAPPPEDESAKDKAKDGEQETPPADEDETGKYKRIARQKEKETTTARTERDEAITRAETAESALQEAQAAAVKVPDLEEKLGQRDLEIARYKVGAKNGLTLKQAARLKGSTAEEIEADAKEFIADNAMPSAPGGQRQPGESTADFVARMNRNR